MENSNNLNLEALTQDNFYLSSPPRQGEDVALENLPDHIRTIFQALINEDRAFQATQADEDAADEPYETEYTIGKTKNGFYLGMHDPDAPFNPSGYDYYFDRAGSYTGYGES